MNQVWKAGDKSKAICEHCKSIVSTTFKHRKRLVAVCDQCDSTVSIPQQSFSSKSLLIDKKRK